MDGADAVFILSGSVALLTGLLSLQRGRSLAGLLRVSEHCRATRAAHPPRVSLLAPCCGLDCDFEAHAQALLAQDYPSYQVLFLVESKADPAWAVLRQHLMGVPRSRAVLIATGPGERCGQKLHNLLVGLDHCDPTTDVLAFVDSDGHVHPHWLAALVAPLQDPSIGATSGFRWYVPVGGSLSGSLRSAWNASSLSLMVHPRYGFAWGGSTAIRRQVFDALRMREAWSQGVSDDWLLTQAVRAAGLAIRFVPGCLVPTREPCTWRALAEWTTRQVTITRVYGPRTWRVVWLLQGAYLVLGLLGLAALISGRWVAAGLSLTHWLCSGLSSMAVCRAALQRLATQGRASAQRAWPQALWTPAVTLLTLINIAVSRMTRNIRWRGISYTLRSPRQVVVRRDAPPAAGILAPLTRRVRP